MANIVITFDTNTKKAVFTKDGAEMTDVNFVEVYKYDEEKHSIGVSMSYKGDDGCYYNHRLSAENTEGSVPSDKIPGLFDSGKVNQKRTEAIHGILKGLMPR